MDGSQLFEVWAPEDSVWSRWAKPALFAGGPQVLEPAVSAPAMPAMPVHPVDPVAPPGSGSYSQAPFDPWTAFVVDMPGERSVEIGMALARTGYRPVPLFNTAYHQFAIVPVYPILKRLRDGAEELQGLAIPSDAPPVFLLDAKRLEPGAPPEPGKFDNRWAVFPQDFPSANFLLSNNVRRVVLLQEERLQGAPRTDLAHVLLRWQEAGVEIYAQDPDGTMSPRPVQVAKPSAFRSLFYRALTLSGLRRSSAGGFGSVIPIPSQASGTSGFG
ncbi:MAG: hypothetical protein ABUT39_16330 [Acidobacteriota bacterium]